MKAVAQRRAGVSADLLVGRVLCHDVRDAAGKVALDKGARLDAAAAQTLLGLPWEEVHLLVLETGDLHEEEAGRRLAAAVTGDGVEVKGYTGGQWTLTASRRGLLRVDTARLQAADRIVERLIGKVGERLTIHQAQRAEVTVRYDVERLSELVSELQRMGAIDGDTVD